MKNNQAKLLPQPFERPYEIPLEMIDQETFDKRMRTLKMHCVREFIIQLYADNMITYEDAISEVSDNVVYVGEEF